MDFSQIPEGWSFTTARRTILDADIVAFAGLSGDFNPLHIDDEYARQHGYDRRVAHGMLVYSIVTGLRSPLDDLEMIAFLETSRRFVGPVFAGDTIYATYRVKEKRLSTKNPRQGVVSFEVDTMKFDGPIVQTGVDVCLIVNRPQS